jgi:hypothetical protein
MRKEVILNQTYILGGGMGSWAKSRERGVKRGDARVIGGILMFAYSIYPKLFSPDEVNWTPVEESKNTPQMLREWMNKL